MTRTNPDRDIRPGEFLDRFGWADATQEPLAGDMSPRKYMRLIKGAETAILMDAASPMTDFVKMTEWLRSLGLSAPKIIGEIAKDGLLLLEDFGSVSVKSVLQSDLDVHRQVNLMTVELLLRIRNAEFPELKQPTAAELTEWTELVDVHLDGIRSKELSPFRARLEEVLEDVLSHEVTVALRDFHSENLMWLPHRDGVGRLGLLDYQDAFLTHPVYDIMSCLTDARMWITDQTRQDVCGIYLRKSGDNAEDFERAFAAMSAQRNLRILGVFARAQTNVRYVSNTFHYFLDALKHPIFDNVRAQTVSAFPEWMKST